MNYLHWIANCLTDAILIDSLTINSIRQNIGETISEQPLWLDKLSRHILKKAGKEIAPLSKETLIGIIANFAPLAEASRLQKIVIRKVPLQKPYRIQLLNPAVPQLKTRIDLEHWLGLTHNELLWMQGHWKTHQQPERSNHHYHYRWIEKSDGSQRLLEIPKYHLKSLQKRIHQQILKRLPTHSAAHGFCEGRSCLTYVSDHVQQPMLIKFDLKDFFPSVDFRKVYRVFSQLGYDPEIARVLTHLTTHITPCSILDKGGNLVNREHYHQAHLPQGAPSSPLLANLAASRLDKRLQGLATRLGLHYSRYADDGAMSGPRHSAAAIDRLHATIAAIALDEGFALNTRKTKVLGQSQQQRLTHIVVNQKPNLPRQEYDQLKATLFNCVRFGHASQNREMHANFAEHLRGRVTWATWATQLNPAKAAKLWQLYSQIHWD